ncbi:hypothetical protein NGTWS0302_07670 [Mycolicibacterium cyprinidarum]|uniref:PASTA domain-containing protein n=1 Tax=Mycolicibacterium cyprinidarum TaxID=2860311 RepID=A0ABQ4V5Z0_9MYCO|nr:hypothetical protein NGTWS1702_35650 [Mycolicibacterium sp. NGTWSNA01]GJF14824.1 hypothetical protein NGTWS0302_07670 [Mycolicibacterium sp. NGTWS0302]GJF17808.1 hypothetical protein NGTWS1803_36040 [Mycolicibacterium sp. NGTWS1803]
MKHIAFATLCATGLAATMIATATADDGAPSGSSVDDTIRSLESNGYNVIVRRTGSEPLRKCRVGAIRPGHGLTEKREEAGNGPGGFNTSVYLDVIC